MEKFRVFDFSIDAQVDWDYALKVAQSLDSQAESEGRFPITGKKAIVILAEYGAIARRACSPPDGQTVAVVVCPPSVWFCPSKNGCDGVFIEPYCQDRHGPGLEFAGKDDLFDYTNIEARIDAWRFFAEMCSKG